MVKFLLIVFSTQILLSQSFLDAYTNYQDLKKEIKRLGVNHKVIGKSRSGLDIDLIRFGDDKSPAIFVLGNIDGSYLAGTELTMKLIRDLKSGKIKRNGKTIYIVPMPNPDAVQSVFGKVSVLSRLNSVANDDDYDQITDEDGPNDMNNDNIISQMRVLDPVGSYKKDSKFEDLLVKVDHLKNETGTYSIKTEGFDDDQDNKINEDPHGGVDLNRNFTYNYNYFGKHVGENQASEPEVRAIIDFIKTHSNILITVNFSLYDNLFKNWKANTKNFEKYPKPLKAFTTMMNEDKDIYKMLSGLWKRNHKWKSNSKNTGKGTFHEWSYFHSGRWSLAANAWNLNQIKLDTAKFKKQDKMSVEEKLYHYAKAKSLKAAYLDWEKVKHPDYDDVEIGGFNLAYLKNPGKEVLNLTKSSEFVEELSKVFPKLTVKELKIEKLDKGLSRVVLRLRNIGKLPTQGKMAEVSGWMYPVRVVWKLNKNKILSGKRKTLLKSIPGFGGELRLEWLINSSSVLKAELEIISPVIDNIKKTVSLGG